MRVNGRLKKWNSEKGFGFISPEDGGKEVFVHISAFPRDGKSPTVDEQFSYEVRINSEGKTRAVSVIRPGSTDELQVSNVDVSSPVWTGRVLAIVTSAIKLILLAGVFYIALSNGERILSWFSPSKHESIAEGTTVKSQVLTSKYSCDGRIHCSEMTSCAEAQYFLEHCPNVEMDGNHDGEPCEKQWCY